MTQFVNGYRDLFCVLEHVTRLVQLFFESADLLLYQRPQRSGYHGGPWLKGQFPG